MFFELGLLWAIVSLIFGILVIIFPHLLSYLIGAYLIIVGAAGIIRAVF